MPTPISVFLRALEENVLLAQLSAPEFAVSLFQKEPDYVYTAAHAAFSGLLGPQI